MLPEQCQFIVLAGVNKCGTSSLAYALKKHPNIYLANGKEPAFFVEDRFFDSQGKVNEVDLSNYHFYVYKFFESVTHYLDASTIYSGFPKCMKRIMEYRSDAKIVIVFRNPINRAYSAWWHFASDGKSEKHSFHDAIINEAKYCMEAKDLGYSLRSYVSRGFYSNTIRMIWRYFDKSQVLPIKFESMVANKQETLNSIFNFIGVEQVELEFGHKLKSAYPCPMSDEDKEYLKYVYEYSIKDLERMLSWDCSDWLST
ncbi:sulfotransferase [bacterium]|nr:sulfotransferase [bacterium]